MKQITVSILTRMPARKLIALIAVMFWLGASITSTLLQSAILKRADRNQAEAISKNVLYPIAFIGKSADAPSSLLRGVMDLASRQPGVIKIQVIQGDGNIRYSTEPTEVGRIFIDPDIWHHKSEYAKKAVEQLNHLRPDELSTLDLKDANQYLAIQRLGEDESYVTLEYDHSHDAASSSSALMNDFLIESSFLLAFPIFLFWMFDRIWLSRKLKIIDTLEALGRGELGSESGVTGNDEIGKIGIAVDKMSKRLFESEIQLKRMEVLVDSARVALLEITNDKNAIILAATEGISLWGYSPGELVYEKRSFFDLVHPDSLQKFTGLIESAADNGHIDKSEIIKITDCQGKICHVSIQLSEIEFRTFGQPGLALAITDLTTEIQKEKEIFIQDQQINHFFNLPLIGMIILDKNSKKVIQANTHAASLFGMSDVEMLGINPVDLLILSDETPRASLFDDSPQFDVIAFSAEIDNPSKGRIHVNVQARKILAREFLLDSNSELDQIFITVSEDLGLKYLENSIMQTHRLLDLAENEFHAGTWTYNIATDVFELSPYCAHLLGISQMKARVTSQEIYERIDQQYLSQFADFVSSLNSPRTDCNTFFQVDKGDDSSTYVSGKSPVSALPIINNPEVRLGLFIKMGTPSIENTETGLDSRLSQIVEIKTKALQDANNRLSAYSYSISHDLKSPLRIIDGYCSLLKSECTQGISPEGDKYLEQIQGGIRQMSQIISDLLTYSKYELSDSRIEPVDIGSLVNSETEIFRACKLFNTSITIAVEAANIRTDKVALQVIIRNLIDNGIKFSAKSEHPRVEVFGALQDDNYCLSFKDNGVGINLKYRDQIFGLFQRLHRKEEYPGTGVGLAMVAVALNRIDGHIAIDSTIGEGTTFSITFPRVLNGQDGEFN